MLARAQTRRESVRRKRRFKVTLRHGPAFTVDVSEAGFCTQLVRVLPPGTDVEGTIQLGDKDVPFAGRVAWAKPGEPRVSLKGRMGVAFTRVAAELREYLSQSR